MTRTVRGPPTADRVLKRPPAVFSLPYFQDVGRLTTHGLLQPARFRTILQTINTGPPGMRNK